jgi:hypothetical protein
VKVKTSVSVWMLRAVAVALVRESHIN